MGGIFMRYCKNCGAGLSDDASFCSNCGANVENDCELVDSSIVSYKSLDIKEREIALAVIFSVLTCGIYCLYWMVKVNDEALSLSKERGQSGVVVILLNIITCGLFGIYWSYKMGNCVDKIKNMPDGNNGILYIILSFLGLGLVNLCLIQSAINDKVCEK